MANTIVQAEAPDGGTFTLKLYALNGDTILNGVGDALTERTNNLGTYTATVTEALTGVHEARITDASDNTIAKYVTDELVDDTGTYKCHDTLPVSVDSNPISAEASFFQDFFTVDSGEVSGSEVSGSAILEIAKVTWDRILTGATHNINNSGGKRLRQLGGTILADGTAQDTQTTTSIKVAPGTILADDQFHGSRLVLISGSGSLHEAIMVESVASTQIVTFTPASRVATDNTTEYLIAPGLAHGETSNQGYADNAVYIDTLGGNSGTVHEVNGTMENPSDNIADATTIASNISPVPYKHFSQRKGSSITLAQAYTAFIFNGLGGSLNLGGQVVNLCTIISQNVTGAASASTTGRLFFRNCLLSNVSSTDGAFTDCSLAGTFTVLDTGSYSFINSLTQDASNPPTLDFGAAVANTNIELLNWDGPITISNLGASGVDTLYITGAGEITLDASCTGGTLVYAGTFTLTNNGTTSSITAIGGGGGDATEEKQDTIIANQALTHGVGFDTSTGSLEALRALIVASVGGGLAAGDLDTIIAGVIAAASALAVKSADSLDTDEFQMITGDTWVQQITGLGDLTAVDEILFAMKSDDEDLDAASLLFVRQSTGLEVFNGSAHATPGDATIVTDDLVAGDITITVKSGFTGFSFGTNKGTIKLLDTALDRTIVNRVIVNTREGGVDEVSP